MGTCSGVESGALPKFGKGLSRFPRIGGLIDF